MVDGFASIRELLEAKDHQLQRQKPHRPEGIRPEREVRDLGDVSNDNLEMDLVAARCNYRTEEARQFEQARLAIEDGQHGICIDCGNPIPKARLKAVPFAIRCVPCQAELEPAGTGKRGRPYRYSL